MHPRNPYRTPIDFSELAEAYPSLRSYLIHTANGGHTLDFGNAEAQICLTKALLHRDFGLDVQLTPERLCPPVPNRLNYILWLQDIIAATQDKTSGPVLGIDVGTGASAIYPLLGCATDARWAFVATELDPLSLRFARENVARNGLDKTQRTLANTSPRIEILQASEDGLLLLPLVAYPNRQFAFSICNPPFYESGEEIAACAAGKARPAVGARRVGGGRSRVNEGSRRSMPGRESTPGRSTPSRHTTPGSRQSTPGPELATALAGAPIEMVTPGGEVAFVARMVAESVRYGERCRWYTSMLGKLSSVAEVVRVLKEHEIDNYAITELVQGQTRRWAIGWSFTSVRLPDSLARVSSQALQSVLPLRNEMTQPLPHHIAIDTSWNTRVEVAVRDICGALPGVTVRSNAQTHALTISATANTWSRAARRKAQREATSKQLTPDHRGESALVVLVSWSTSGQEETEASSTALEATTDAMDWENNGDGAPGDAAAEYAVEGRRKSSDSAMDVDHPADAARGPSTHESASPVLCIRWMRGRDRTLFETFWSHLSRKVVGMLA
ncbi:hypothetical protein K523DRAFT_299131 [Schizophyllum commune Tattone D]|nr:hypothetical protein K523DRAFT_299131 [Schizophyllum commune Tattone D]